MTSTNRLTWICGTLILPLLLIDGGAVANQLYSEGGSFMVQDDRSPSQESRANENTDYFAEEQTQYKQQMDMQNALEEAKRQRLAKIVAQLEQENSGGQKIFGSENDGASERHNSNIAANEWDVLKEMILKNWHKIKDRIETLLNRGRALRSIINEKCIEDENLWEKFWETLVEETNELRGLIDTNSSKNWKKSLLGEYSLYSKLCYTAEKTLNIMDRSAQIKSIAIHKNRNWKFFLAKIEKCEINLRKLLIEGASGESNELSKKHKRIWLHKINDALVDCEVAIIKLEKMAEKMVEGEEEETPEVNLETSSKKLAAVKKGQNEFVEFVEPMPKPNNRHKTPEWMEKRIPYESGHNSNHFKFFTNSGNILFMAYLVVCCAGIVAATVGGVYYYNQVRANRIDDPFNEFTRYSPAGPGKDKLKKSGSPTFGQNGDDTLAYKTQLHHYQQQKQKILGNSPGGVIENISDNEEDTDEMDHNYSVFECPGLAPTCGDLEIQNPNFMGAGKPDPSQRRAD